MPVPGLITDLSETPSSNSPIGTESVGTIMNQYIQAAYAFIRQIYDGSLNPQAALNFNGQKITNVANGVASTDVATVGQIAGAYVPLAGAVTVAGSLTDQAGFISSGYDAGGMNFRAVNSGGTYGAGLRTDATAAFLLSTASGSPLGTYNSLRPLYWNLSSGAVNIDGTGAGVTMSGNLSVAGTVTAGNLTATSDEREKCDWAELAPNFVQRLAKVKSGTFTMKSTGERSVGVSAQSLRRVLKEATCKGKGRKGRWSVAYGQAAMVSSIELAKKVVELEARLAKMERAK